MRIEEQILYIDVIHALVFIQRVFQSIDDFLQGFPSVTRNQVVAFLEEAKDLLVDSVS